MGRGMLSGSLVDAANPTVVASSLLGWTRRHGELLTPYLEGYSPGYQLAMLLWWSQGCFSLGINCFFQAPSSKMGVCCGADREGTLMAAWLSVVGGEHAWHTGMSSIPVVAEDWKPWLQAVSAFGEQGMVPKPAGWHLCP